MSLEYKEASCLSIYSASISKERKYICFYDICQLGVLKIHNRGLQVMAIIACRTQTITFYDAYAFLRAEMPSFSHCTLQPRVHCLTTVPFAGHGGPRISTNWQWLTEKNRNES